MRRRRVLVAALAVTLAACASREVLLPKPAAVPPGVDLSGQWRLRETTGQTRPAAREALVHVFLETGETIRVSQTSGALFLSFDRSIVEEYRFGEQRKISVGEITADRVSGWVRDSYVVETLDRDGAKLTDRYRLEEDGEVLHRTIRLTDGNDVELDLEQVFDRE